MSTPQPSHHHHGQLRKSERIPLMAIACLAVATFIVVLITGPASRPGTDGIAERGIARDASRMIVFEDAEAGTVHIRDAESSDIIATFGVSEGGFLRSALRAILYQRSTRGDDLYAPIELARAESGLTILYDPLTDRLINLDAFGPKNRDQFAALLVPATSISQEGAMQ